MLDAQVRQVGRGFVATYAAALFGTSLVLIAPLLVTLALKVEGLVGSHDAPKNLALVVGVGSLVSMFSNPFFGRMSDRTTSRLGRRRPWMVIGLVGGTGAVLVVAVAPNIATVLVGWCLVQLFFNALLAAATAVLPDQVPVGQRGQVAGVLGICVPLASVSAAFLVDLFSGHQLAMFLVPCAVGGFLVAAFAIALDDRPLRPDQRPAWSMKELGRTFYFNPRLSPDLAWAFASRFMLVMAYAFLVTYQAYYLTDRLGTDSDDVPRQIFLGTLVQASLVITISLVSGRLSDRTGQRKPFVVVAALVYGVALFLIAAASSFAGFLAGMAVSGVGFGMYFAVDLALVADVLPDESSAAKDLGVLNFAGAVPFFLAPVIAPLVLAVSDRSYGVLYAVAGACAVAGAAAILPVKAVR